MEDIFIACTDNLTGFSAAIGAVFPKTEIQNCIIHQLRNSSKYVPYKDIKALMADLRSVYAAVDEPARTGRIFNQVGYEISQDITVMAGKLGESQHVF